MVAEPRDRDATGCWHSRESNTIEVVDDNEALPGAGPARTDKAGHAATNAVARPGRRGLVQSSRMHCAAWDLKPRHTRPLVPVTGENLSASHRRP